MTQSSTLFLRRSVFFWHTLVIWGATTKLFNSLFWVDLIHDFAEMQVTCNGVPGVFSDCNLAALVPAEVSVWTSRGLSIQTHASLAVAGAVFTFLVYVMLTCFLQWQPGRSRLSLTISLALIAIPYTIFADSRDFGAINPDLIWINAAASVLGNGIVLLFLYLMPNESCLARLTASDPLSSSFSPR